MTKLALRLSAEALAALGSLAKQGPKRLAAVIERLDANAQLVRPSDVRAEITSALGSDTAASVANHLITWAALGRENNASPAEIVESIEQAIVEAEAPTVESSAWAHLRAPLQTLLSCAAIYHAAKALSLAYDSPRFCIGSRILTDIRPIFAADDNSIVGSIICQTLRVDYVDPQGQHTISIAMDAEEIERLGRACARAQGKATNAQAFVSKMSLPSFVSGEEKYDVDR
jgi:hypothetical protein